MVSVTLIVALAVTALSMTRQFRSDPPVAPQRNRPYRLADSVGWSARTAITATETGKIRHSTRDLKLYKINPSDHKPMPNINSASITLLSGVIYFLRECRVAIRTMSGRSQQP